MNKVFRRGGVTPPLLFIIMALSLVSCRSQGTSTGPTAIADAFVQAYYVDTNIKAALDYCDRLACETLTKELNLREGQKIAADTQRPQVTAKRVGEPPESGDVRRFLYRLKVSPPGMDAFQREAYVKLRRRDDAWKVTHFAELK